MSEELIKSKKSSRLNAKKDDKIELQVNKQWSSIILDIIVTCEERLEESPQIFRKIPLYRNSKNELIGSHLAEYLRSQDIAKEESSVSFYDDSKHAYIFGFLLARDLREMTKNVPFRFITNNALMIKVRSKRRLIVDALLEQQRIRHQDEDPSNRMVRQKKIGEVVEKVALWRKLYTGFYDEFGAYIQKPLETAAQEVGIAKKTLDDYLLQIRNGKKYGFNFNEKVNAKIGELRAFVREQKKKEQGK